MYVISRAELRFVWNIVNVHVYSVENILTVLIFYFAPSINRNDIIRQEKCSLCNKHISIEHTWIEVT